MIVPAGCRGGNPRRGIAWLAGLNFLLAIAGILLYLWGTAGGEFARRADKWPVSVGKVELIYCAHEWCACYRYSYPVGEATYERTEFMPAHGLFRFDLRDFNPIPSNLTDQVVKSTGERFGKPPTTIDVMVKYDLQNPQDSTAFPRYYACVDHAGKAQLGLIMLGLAVLWLVGPKVMTRILPPKPVPPDPNDPFGPGPTDAGSSPGAPAPPPRGD